MYSNKLWDIQTAVLTLNSEKKTKRKSHIVYIYYIYRKGIISGLGKRSRHMQYPTGVKKKVFNNFTIRFQIPEKDFLILSTSIGFKTAWKFIVMILAGNILKIPVSSTTHQEQSDKTLIWMILRIFYVCLSPSLRLLIHFKIYSKSVLYLINTDTFMIIFTT